MQGVLDLKVDRTLYFRAPFFAAQLKDMQGRIKANIPLGDQWTMVPIVAGRYLVQAPNAYNPSLNQGQDDRYLAVEISDGLECAP